MNELVPRVGWADVATKHDLDLHFGALDGRMTGLDGRVNGLEQRMDRLDQRMDRLEQRMDRFEVKLDDVAREIWAQTWKLVSLMAAVMGIVVAAVRL